MLHRSRIVLGLLMSWTCAANGQNVPAQPTTKVELRWVESKHIEGLTEENGFQCSCDPNDIVYPHKKPALVLAAAEVAEVTLRHLDLSKNGLSRANYLVNIQLTKEARTRLASTVEGKEMKLLTVRVDDKYWGVRRYEKDRDKPFVPQQARAETFVVDIGYFSSKAEAQRVVDAVK